MTGLSFRRRLVTIQLRIDVFHAIADPTRRAILDRLRDGGKAVNEIAGRFDVSRPPISKHLGVLHEARLVTEAREGRNRVYRLNPEPLRELDRWLALEQFDRHDHAGHDHAHHTDANRHVDDIRAFSVVVDDAITWSNLESWLG